MDKELLKARFEELKKIKENPNLASPPPQALPSVAQMAKNVTKSLITNTKAFVTGKGLTLTTEDADARLTICKGCDFFDSNKTRCLKCGCQMAVKTYLKAEKCPIGKW
jgi:hypothetical protein